MYVKAQYFRNAGLGNKLFPWARAIVLAEKYGYEFIDPVWFSPRGASLTRGGINYAKALNKIWLLNNFRKRKQDIAFFSALFIKEYNFQFCDDLPQALAILNSVTKTNIVFRWNTCHCFTDLQQYRNLIVAALKDITKKKSIAFVKNFNYDFIGLNIRTGKDFIKAGSVKKGYYLTDINWFIKALKIIRKKAGNLPALIISDGGVKQIDKILNEPATTLLQSDNAIEDLLILSKSKVLLGSGNSSFSAWASFLGAMDTFSSEQTSFTHFKIRSEKISQVIGIL